MLLIFLSQAAWARRLVMRFSLARRTALRFVAGEELDDALSVVAQLNQAGMLATLDLLGEHTESPSAAEKATQAICDAISRLSQNNLRASISIKLTQIGLNLDENLCTQNVEQILKIAGDLDIFVRIDMEESEHVESTLDIYRKMIAAGLDNVGVVIQSYLYRSEKDTAQLLEEGSPIRLVKGAYMENPEIAYPKKSNVDASFDRLTRMLLTASKKLTPRLTNRKDTWPPLAAIATHDGARVRFAEEMAEQIGLEKELVEFQMLYGIRRDLQVDLVARGYPVRIYLPFGREWYPYFMRRLAERPANLWFFISNLFRS